MSDRFDEELAMLADVRRYIRSVEGPPLSISTSVLDRVLGRSQRHQSGPGRRAAVLI
ncbi:hypothetical protein [Rhodococcus globerulus]|uniref:hypothetical protein n=1 Tax=Rhodococcus globerulus TaxID=33008 RepID=UPI003018B620